MTEVTLEEPVVPIPPSGGPGWLRSHVQLVAAAGAVLLVLLGAAAVYLLTRPEQVKVPSVARLEYVSAMQTVRKAGLEPKIVPVRSDSPTGQIVSQSPRADTEADEGSDVVLRLSLGPGVVAVPDVRGQSRAAATRALEGSGLGVTFARGPSPTVPPGKVASTSPAATTDANRGTKVVVTISTGPQKVKVPDFGGLKEADAESQAQAAGLRVVIVHEESSATAGQVIGQKPAAGKRAKKGATARIVVATAPPAVTVPGVTGQGLSAAVPALSGAGLRVEIAERASKQAKGTVLEQSVPANSSKPRGTTVTITVSSG